MNDDFVAAFSLESEIVRGRIVRLGPGSLDPILRRHDYPRAVALLLGEAIALAVLIGSLFKTEGRFVVQAEGDGPVSMFAAEARSDGGVRAYARLNKSKADGLDRALPPRALIGEGHLAITLDQGERAPPHQGLVPLEGQSLAECAGNYFRASEQTETRIYLAVGELIGAEAPACWRAGGMLMQRIARDETRANSEEDWRRAAILFDTVTDEELLDPALPVDRVLYRLFHEEGVRMNDPQMIIDRCTCDADRLKAIMSKFTAEETADLVEPDGFLHARCEFCARAYKLDPAALRI